MGSYSYRDLCSIFSRFADTSWDVRQSCNRTHHRSLEAEICKIVSNWSPEGVVDEQGYASRSGRGCEVVLVAKDVA
jgi:hypothetical protein